jgi:hypothetical protein
MRNIAEKIKQLANIYCHVILLAEYFSRKLLNRAGEIFL